MEMSIYPDVALPIYEENAQIKNWTYLPKAESGMQTKSAIPLLRKSEFVVHETKTG
jgi:hypothetical protein